MDRVEELRALLRKDEYIEAEQKETILNEAANEYRKGITAKIYDRDAPLRRMRSKCAFMKEIICECMCNLYESSLIIDDVDKYSSGLRSVMKDNCMSIMENATNNSELESLFENSSPYVKNMLTLAEQAYEEKTDEEVKEFNDKILLSKDDLNLIKKFETDEGKDVYASGLQDRVIDVYKAEEKIGEEQKDKVQAVVDALIKTKASVNADNNNSISESVENGINLFNTTPKSIFNAIFINKSKGIMNESSSANLEEDGEKILAETIATYTLLETIHSLGFKSYTDKEKRDLIMQFFIS